MVYEISTMYQLWVSSVGSAGGFAIGFVTGSAAVSSARSSAGSSTGSSRFAGSVLRYSALNVPGPH